MVKNGFIILILIFNLGCSSNVTPVLVDDYNSSLEIYPFKRDLAIYGLKGKVSSFDTYDYFAVLNNGKIEKKSGKKFYYKVSYLNSGDIKEMATYEVNTNKLVNHKETVFDDSGNKKEVFLKKRGDLDTTVKVEIYYKGSKQDSILNYNEFNFKPSYKIILSFDKARRIISEESIPLDGRLEYSKSLFQYDTIGLCAKEVIYINSNDSVVKLFSKGDLKIQQSYKDGKLVLSRKYEYANYDSNGNWTLQRGSTEYVEEGEIFYDISERNIQYFE